MPPGPRKEPQPILLVYTLYASKRTCGMLYGPRTMVGAISELRGWQAKPVSKYIRAWRATSKPSRVTPVFRWSTPPNAVCPEKLFFAGHDYFDGRPVRWARSAVRFQDGSVSPTKAPTHVRHNHPHFMHGHPSSDATRERTTYVPCVLVQIVSLPPGSYWAIVAIGSR